MPNPPVRLSSQLAPWDSRKLPVLAMPESESHFAVPGRKSAAQQNNASALAPLVARVYDPRQYPSTASSYAAVPATAPGLLLLSQSSALRTFFSIRNDAVTSNLYVDFGGPASTKSPFKLLPGQTMLLDNALPQGDIYVIGDFSDCAAAYAYATMPAP